MTREQMLLNALTFIAECDTIDKAVYYAESTLKRLKDESPSWPRYGVVVADSVTVAKDYEDAQKIVEGKCKYDTSKKVAIVTLCDVYAAKVTVECVK